jgi:two-component system, LytTR family, sensor kinase
MNNFTKKLNGILMSRLARNIYFWLLLFLIKYSDAHDQDAYPLTFYYGWMVILMLYFAALSYINNLLLVPKLLFRKKRLQYFVSVFLLTFGVAYAYTCTMKALPIAFPGFDAMQVSMVMSPIDNDFSFMGVLVDMQSYFVIMVMWVTIFTLFWFFNNSGERIRNMENEIIRHREAELSFLKNQINPHFLFNTLNNLYGLALKKSDEAPETILKLSSILRYILYESNVEKISTETEKEIMQAYIDIELLRLPPSSFLNFSISTDKSYNIAPLLWLPILENTFKHSRSAGQTEIDFRFSIENNQLLIHSKNNIGVNTKDNKTGGIGLNNLKKRLDILFPGKYRIDQKSADNYFIIELHIILN